MKAVTASIFLILCSPPACAGAAQPCGAGMAPAEAYRRAAAVFMGKVLDVRRLETSLKSGTTIPHHEVRLKVERSWKLVDRAEVAVTTRSVYENTCGSFKPGESYLVYADRMNDTLYVVPASRTNLAARAGEDLEYLGDARVALRPGEFRTHKVLAYGLITGLLLLLLIGWYLRRLQKSPLP